MMRKTPSKQLQILSVDELIVLSQAQEQRKIRQSAWCHDQEHDCLEHLATKYWIPLGGIASKDSVLRWIMHANQKRWADAKTVADLVWWLDRLFYWGGRFVRR